MASRSRYVVNRPACISIVNLYWRQALILLKGMAILLRLIRQMNTLRGLLTGLIASLGATLSLASAQVAVDVSGYGVKVQTGQGSSVNVNSGTVAPDVQMEGVAVINGEVFIDGEQVPKGKTSYIAKKTGKSYRIQWGKDGNVSVSEK